MASVLGALSSYGVSLNAPQSAKELTLVVFVLCQEAKAELERKGDLTTATEQTDETSDSLGATDGECTFPMRKL